MEFRLLQYFVTIAQEKNISRAAERLHITQPTLSRQLQQLEEELGVTLFLRSSRQLQLTNEGQYLYNRAIEILQLVDTTQESLTAHNEVTGNLYIGAAETASLALIADATRQLTQQYPTLRLNFQSGNSDAVYEGLDRGTLDFGIVFRDNLPQKYHSLELPSHDHWGILVPVTHPLANVPQVTLADVIPYPLIVSSQSNVDATIFAGLGNYHIVATYNLLYNASLLVRAGVGIALGFDGIVEHPELTFVPLDNNTVGPLHLIWKPETMTANMRAFLNSVQEQLAN